MVENRSIKEAHQARIEAVKTHVESVCNSSNVAPNLEKLNNDIQLNLKSNLDYEKLIDSFAERKDAKSNITWHKNEIAGDSLSTPSLVRDARNAKSPPQVLADSYVMQSINCVRASIDIIKHEKGQEAADEFKQKIDVYLKDFINKHQDNSNIKEVESDTKKLNARLVVELEKAGIKSPEKKIEKAKDFQNFKDEHRHITTIYNQTNDQGKTVVAVESDVMNLGLTEKQKIMFDAIKNHKGGDIAPLNHDGEAIDMQWFNKMPELDKNFLQDNAEAIAKGNKVIPTQLRKEVPLLRNAYTKVTGSIAENGRLEVASVTTHSGTVTIATKGDNQALTNGIIKQAQAFTSNGRINLNTLTSPSNPIGEVDKADKRYITGAQKEMAGVSRSSTPYNALRNLPGGGGRDFGGYQESLDSIGKDLCKNSQQEYQVIGNFLQGKDKDAKQSQAALATVADPEIRSALTHAISAKQTMNEIKIVGDNDHDHAKITVDMKLLVSRVNDPKGPLQKLGVQVVADINTSCASGKDRTGAVECHTSRAALDDKLGTRNKDQNLKAQLAAGHTQNMAGIQGGTIGCHGIKPETSHALPKMFEDTRGWIGQEPADMNKIKADKKELATLRKEAKQENKEQEMGMFSKIKAWVQAQVDKIKEKISDLFKPKEQEAAAEQIKSSNKTMIVERQQAKIEISNVAKQAPQVDKVVESAKHMMSAFEQTKTDVALGAFSQAGSKSRNERGGI